MKIIVVGCGKIGSTIISNLVTEGHNVVAVDNSAEIIADITNIYDVMGVCGNGVDCDVLEEAGVKNAELFVSVTGSDEFNMLSCYIANKMGANQTIARIRNPEYNDNGLVFLKQNLNLSLAINPELLVAKELYNLLKLPSAAKVEMFSKRNFEMIELRLKPDSKLDGMSLVELKKKYPYNYLVCAVKRDEMVYIPDGNFILKSGDKIAVAATISELIKFLKSIEMLQKQARNIMILGASKTAFYLSKMLLAGGNNVKIIEKDAAICEEFAEQLPSAVIINGDGAQQELLLEEGIGSMDAFVSLTGMDEQNILISYFASSQNVPRVITKINRDEFTTMADKLGLDSVISPRLSTAAVIVRYARALNNSIGSSMETLYRFMDGSAEAMEFIVSSDCPIVNIPLKELKTKNNTLIAGIVRGKKTIVPSGDDMILPGDNVIVVVSGHKIDNLTEIVL